MKKKKRIAERLKAFVDKKPINVWCANGLCEGEVFQAEQGTRELRVVIPANECYKMAIYQITDKITSNGEHAAIFLRGVPR